MLLLFYDQPIKAAQRRKEGECLASEKRGSWDIRPDKVNRMFKELDVLMLGAGAVLMPPVAGIAAAAAARLARTTAVKAAEILDAAEGMEEEEELTADGIDPSEEEEQDERSEAPEE